MTASLRRYSRLTLASVLGFFLVSCATPSVQPPAVSASSLPKVLGQGKQAHYIRSVQTGSDTFCLQTGSRLFRRAGSPDIDLIGAMHAADGNYYQELRKELFLSDLILYEGVIDENQQQQVFTEQEKNAKLQKSGYGRFARSLGLSLQHQAIPYKDKRFRRSDMSIQQMQAALEKERRQGGNTGSQADHAGEQFSHVRKSIGGKSLMTNMMLSLIGMNSALQERVRLMLVAQGGKYGEENDGLSPRLQRLILEDRNAHVIGDLKHVLTKESGHRRIALFYGAAHLPDLQKHLERMGYRAAGPIRWDNAITSHPYSSGISTEEVNELFAK